jgi:drug/metabolite transporter (DMT)-like permease
MFNKVIQLSGPLFTSSVTYLIPVVALGWGIADSETLGWIQYISMMAIIVGVYMVNKSK